MRLIKSAQKKAENTISIKAENLRNSQYLCDMKLKPQILFEDEDLVIVNKPPWLLSIPDRYSIEKPNLLAWLKRRFGDEIYTVHRLDKETSGILCFARNAETHKALNQQFQLRTTEKIYLTLVEGPMHKEEGSITGGILPHPHLEGRMIISSKGKPSQTDYKVKERFGRFTLLEANIKTGRMHQIRVHFDSIGYPLAVDRVYGRREELFASEIKGKKFRSSKYAEDRPLIARTILHAFRLELDHPRTGERLVQEAPLPKDFKAVIQQLQKWDKLK